VVVCDEVLGRVVSGVVLLLLLLLLLLLRDVHPSHHIIIICTILSFLSIHNNLYGCLFDHCGSNATIAMFVS